MREVRKCSIKPVKIVCFAPMASFAILRLATMWKDVLDMPDIKGHLEERAKAAGMDLGGYVTEVCVCGFGLFALCISISDRYGQNYTSASGKVLEFPGLPHMYDYENYPQEV